VMDISAQLRGLFGADIDCAINRAAGVLPEVPAPMVDLESVCNSGRIKRLPCKDAESHSNLRDLLRLDGMKGSSDSLMSTSASSDTSSAVSFGRMSQYLDSETSYVKYFDIPEHVPVEVDLETSSDFIMMTVVCEDRKGLLYDIFLKLKEIRVRVAYCRVHQMELERVRVELTIQDAYGGYLCSAQEIPLLVARVKYAAARPLQIVVANGAHPHQIALSVIAPVDAGGRGRPRVTYDVTRVLSVFRLQILQADVYTEEIPTNEEESLEIHTFMIANDMHLPQFSVNDKEIIVDAIMKGLEGKSQQTNNKCDGRCSDSKKHSSPIALKCQN